MLNKENILHFGIAAIMLIMIAFSMVIWVEIGRSQARLNSGHSKYVDLCIKDYSFIEDKNGNLVQILDKNGFGVKCN